MRCCATSSSPAPSATPPTPPIDAYVAQRDPEIGVPTIAWLDEQPNPGSSAKDVAWRVLRSLPFVRNATPDWESWTRRRYFPFGLALSSIVVFYLLAALWPQG